MGDATGSATLALTSYAAPEKKQPVTRWERLAEQSDLNKQFAKGNGRIERVTGSAFGIAWSILVGGRGRGWSEDWMRLAADVETVDTVARAVFALCDRTINEWNSHSAVSQVVLLRQRELNKTQTCLPVAVPLIDRFALRRRS